ncbi:hypothetical protein Poli38472_009105 [Pythium oligandrum]|uniref:Uncharacterized protein n=1 Tax=Pythium oligandrum TaxID=41045 RepID=A0A8K1CL30_PYTOL|nr:hypothetical protein Poli38472_009105 [Pythium oligandrum]|eukprot:TMW64938.1 hypothetical protein Poli38472_009105 [Pythium oligandrum]
MSAAISAAFTTYLQAQGQHKTHEDLLREYAPEKAPSEASVTLEECRFYDEFMRSPQDANAANEQAREEAKKTHAAEYVDKIMASRAHHELKKDRQYDFRLEIHEQERLKQNGFVVSSRLHAESFAEIYYRLYTDDMPVYITTDSVLHAWHRSFDAFLVDLEEQELLPLLQKVLDDTSAACKGLVGDGALRNAILDVDLFLTVAKSLLLDEQQQGLASNNSRVASLYKMIENEEMTSINIFGIERSVDFSLFKPRGHYSKSEELQRYFRTVTWLGTVDFRVDNGEDAANDRYQLQCAILLVHCLRVSKQINHIKGFAEIIATIVGDGLGADSMSPVQLDSLLGDTDLVATYFSPNSEAVLTKLQGVIAASGFGTQAIAGHPHFESVGSTPHSPATTLPTSFAFLGQQFVWSAFVFSKLVYDQVRHEQTKVIRRIPNVLDVIFAMLGNDSANEEIARRMTMSHNDKDFVKFRDGVPYTSNLLALRQTVDTALDEVKLETASLSALWILALRELSAPSENSSPVFQSKAWKCRQMNTQLASFAQLRHDTILYAKQGFTIGTRCEYAAGYVDPYPSFWSKMLQLAKRSSIVIQTLDRFGEDDESDMRYKAREFFLHFAETMATLKDIAQCQVDKKHLDEEQEHFVKTVMEERFGSGGSRYMGWYPSLFYTSRQDSGKEDHLVADVHTDTPSVEHGDVGGVLHVGVGDVNCGFFVVDKTMYAGPVFSSYEFVTPINERLTDEEFSTRLPQLAPPDWARNSYLC